VGTILVIASVYIAFGFIRAIYRLFTGFLYIAPLETPAKRRHFGTVVSVVIPAWNEEIGVARTIQSVLDNGYKKLDIIVVDDGSTDDTRRVADEFAISWPSKVRVISQRNGGKASALNTGIAAARGSLILTLDADSYLEQGSIAKMVSALVDKQYGVAIGEVVVGNTKTIIGRAQHFEYSVGFHVKRAQHVFNSAYIFPGALTMFRKSVLQEIGEFTDYSSTEDLDISMRIKMAGYKITYVDSAICVTEGATNLKGLLNQRTRWRHGYIECLLHHRDFILSTKKGKYLTFIDLPLQLFGVLETILFPVILGGMALLISMNANPTSLLIALLLVPFMLVLLALMREKHNSLSLWVLAMPLMLIMIEFIEWLAIMKSIYRAIRRKRTAWTVWQRSGASNN